MKGRYGSALHGKLVTGTFGYGVTTGGRIVIATVVMAVADTPLVELTAKIISSFTA